MTRLTISLVVVLMVVALAFWALWQLQVHHDVAEYRVLEYQVAYLDSCCHAADSIINDYQDREKLLRREIERLKH